MQEIRLLETQHKELMAQLSNLEKVLEHFTTVQAKQENRLRKELFRLSKEQTHLVAKLNSMEEKNQKQQKVSVALINHVMSFTSRDEMIDCTVAHRKLNFNPIYD